KGTPHNAGRPPQKQGRPQLKPGRPPLKPPLRGAAVRTGAVSMAAKRQLRKSFELFIIDRFSTSLDTARSAKSHFIFTWQRVNETGGSRVCAATPPVTDLTGPDGSFHLA